MNYIVSSLDLQIVILLGLVAMAAADSDEFRGYRAPRVSLIINMLTVREKQ